MIASSAFKQRHDSRTEIKLVLSSMAPDIAYIYIFQMICLKGTIEKKPNAGRTDVKLKCLKCLATGAGPIGGAIGSQRIKGYN
jgi:hypothetical protein